MTKFLAETFERVCSVVAILMMLHISVDVLLRYLFSQPLTGTIEIVSAYYMVAIIFLPLAKVTLTKSHIVVDLFTRKFSKRMIARLDTVNGAVTVCYLALIVFATSIEAWAQTSIGEVWQAGAEEISVWPTRWLVPAGTLLMCSATILVMVSTVKTINDKKLRG